MGYRHIPNLYKEQEVLLFRRCYAMEKIDGTSANVKWKNGKLSFFSGGATHSTFVALFDHEALTKAFEELGIDDITIHGEAYGGKLQGMSATYGKELKFCAFEVRLGEHCWLSVPQAEDIIVKRLGLEFVDYVECPTDLEVLDAERAKPSTQGIRNGMGEHPREGIIIRPLIEVRKNNGDRIMAKHKNDQFRETAKVRKVVDPAQLEILSEAEDIAIEWVTDERLRHVISALKADDATAVQIVRPEGTGVVIKAMIADIYREAAGEIVESKEAAKAIGKKTAQLFGRWLKKGE